MFLKCFLLFFIFAEIGALEPLGHDNAVSLPCPYPKFKNGRVRMRLRRQLARFVCNIGFELYGNKYASCRNGEWDVPIPVCIKPGCGLQDIENGLPMGSHNNAWVVYFCFPEYVLIGSPVIYCDGRKWNTTAPVCIPTPKKSELSCNFEDPNICGWKQDELHDFDWKRLNKRTPSSFLFTGPSYDHTFGPSGNVSGYYMYIESTSRLENDTARLISPIYDASLTQNGCFQFFYHMFGKTTGGLRVYQKPESVGVQSEKNHLLFEQWGDQGDFWYTGLATLMNVTEDFQIVIEGIRGKSFTSDIAIDDVAILQGENCTVMKKAATTPVIISDSCVGRCNVPSNAFECACNITCLYKDNCCHDYFELCMFDGLDTTSQTDVSDLPLTQKLVYSTTEMTEKTSPTTTPSTTLKTTTKIPKTTIRPMTLVFKTTKSIPKVELTTTERTTTLTTIVSTTPKPTTVKIVKTTIKPKNEKEKFKEQAEKKSMPRVMSPDDFFISEHKASQSSGVKTTLIVISTLIISVSIIWVALYMRSAGGREAMARLRGRTRQQHDVRYLTQHEDDDD